MATKAELIQGLEVVINEGRRLSTDLTAGQWARVVDLDGWKNQEVIAHVAGVGGMVVPMVNGLANAPAGADLMAGLNIDEMNAGIVKARAGKSAADLAQELATAYAGVIEFIKQVPAETLERRATAGGHKDLPISDIMMRMVVLHGLGHIYSVYSAIFFATA